MTLRDGSSICLFCQLNNRHPQQRMNSIFIAHCLVFIRVKLNTASTLTEVNKRSFIWVFGLIQISQASSLMTVDLFQLVDWLNLQAELRCFVFSQTLWIDLMSAVSFPCWRISYWTREFGQNILWTACSHYVYVTKPLLIACTMNKTTKTLDS